MIALILGGAPSVWLELAEAQALLNRRHMVVAANLAGIHYAGRLDGWATLHPDFLPGWTQERAGEPAGRLFTPDLTPERWPGSSGLYALQVALFEMGATAAILCGVPMDNDAGHFTGRQHWEGVDTYRQAFAAALPVIGGRVRSMGGWTAELFGKPTAEWVGAVDNITPMGGSAPPDARNDVMNHVKNGSATTLSFWHRQEDGLMGRVHLAPGDAGDFEVDRNMPELRRDGVTVTAPRAAAPKVKPAAAKKPAPKKAAAPQPPKPAPPAPPVSDET